MQIARAALFLIAWLCAGWAWAQPAAGLQPVPALMARVIDQTGTLTAEQRNALDARIAAFEARRGSQIVVLLVRGTQPEDIAAYANRVANTWKIGRRQIGDGVLVIVAKDERKLRIEVAKTLEGAIPDLAARQIIDEALAPALRRNDYAGGLNAALDRIVARIGAEALPAPAGTAAAPGEPVEGDAARHGESGFQWFDLAVFLFVGVVVVGGLLRAMLGPKLGALGTGALAGTGALLITSSLAVAAVAGVLALVWALFAGARGSVPQRVRRYRDHSGGIVLPGGWSGGWSGDGGSWSSSGGGGFSSGGGGDFGGGGASGDW